MHSIDGCFSSLYFCLKMHFKEMDSLHVKREFNNGLRGSLCTRTYHGRTLNSLGICPGFVGVKIHQKKSFPFNFSVDDEHIVVETKWPTSWWCHQMITFFLRYWPFVWGIHHSLVTGEFPSQTPVTWSFDVSFDLHLNKLEQLERLRSEIPPPPHDYPH